ncbi:Rad52/Rad22 family DNA repair protein [Streptomyces tubercidicus]|uniref:Rad52/Rad22 family DNA repair protein n=1 Tax=Streptomyces tubercidicus TaxID=47759 RepID=UPI00346569DD
MANANQAPASAEAPTQHTQNQAPRFSPYQLRMLHNGITSNRVQNLRGMSHLEAWDVRRQLIRIFGFGGFRVETLSLDLVHEDSGLRRKKNKQGEEYGAPYMAWTLVYRAQVRLTILTPDGREITHFEDGAAGDAINQPSVGDAHDLAMKTALSQALKRCAVNLGDQFGLSLYNDGALDAVVNFSAAHPPQDWKPKAEPPQPEPEDPPVKPEPQPATSQDEQPANEQRNPDPAAAPRQDAPAVPQEAPTSTLNQLYWQAVEQFRSPRPNLDAITQIRGAAEAHSVIDDEVAGPPPAKKPMTFRAFLDLLDAHAAAQQERNAA